MDETGLYWRWAISRGLSTASIPGAKKDKARISLALCSNADGSDKVPPWLIGKSKVPRCFRGVNVSAFGVEWRNSTKAWMNADIMAEWLKAFYKHIGEDVEVILLMDNFSAHLAGMELAPPPPNVRIEFLPKNSTSQYQPLDQGIIANYKHYYKRQWLRFCINTYAQKQDPIKTVTLVDALRWTQIAWRDCVTPQTIRHCWVKSTILKKVDNADEDPQPPADLLDLLREAQVVAEVSEDARDLRTFMAPEDEDEEPEQAEPDLQAIINH
ncbi:DDE-domain-containing protein [Zopfia rhizophila CBS 207.26]|uniref:DDE-domain-containing protein n=1 Tax=Zopfia rhizophila CBS 207.26 TaxID=1314779 RepID=A0A6A6F190_9PEZI|nr:DDE-domain-containing protein [Zopfia rhizophila CBS 207.26]